jgi:hypothetical protein
MDDLTWRFSYGDLTWRKISNLCNLAHLWTFRLSLSLDPLTLGLYQMKAQYVYICRVNLLFSNSLI